MSEDSLFLSQAFDQMQDYLLSQELFWSLSANLPRLTPGATLLALTRLRAADPTLAPRFDAELEAVRARWRLAWERKIAREAANRLRLWSQALQDASHAEGQGADPGASDLRGRVILQLLLQEVPHLPEGAALQNLDSLFRAHFSPGAFVWQAIYAPAFPPASFWFLYGKYQNSRIVK